MVVGQFRIRDLELIVALHEEGNMTQAAKRLDISEPALSQQLKKIERRIQSHLFERGNGGLVTTASGRVFVAHAIEIVQEFRRAIQEAHETKHNEAHKLRIGVSTFYPLYLIEMLHANEAEVRQRPNHKEVFACPLTPIDQFFWIIYGSIVFPVASRAVLAHLHARLRSGNTRPSGNDEFPVFMRDRAVSEADCRGLCPESGESLILKFLKNLLVNNPSQ